MIGLVDVGGTKLAAAIAGGDDIGRSARVPTPANHAVDALIDLLDTVRNGSVLDAIAAAVPGPFDRASGALLNPPGMPPGWHGLDLRSALSGHYGCPVHIENDANCAALAEATFGAGRGAGTVVYFTVSTGIGTGVVRDGHLVLSRDDTEGGHQVLWPEWLGGPTCHCGGFGCLEALASGRAIERRFGVSGDELLDPAAWADVGRWLGLGVVNATALLDPDVVIFGGGVCASWDRFAPALHATVESHLHLQQLPRVARGELDESRRNLIGALWLITVGGQ